MQKSKRKLKVIQGKDSPIIEGTTCFAVTAAHGVSCQRKHCRYWIKHPSNQNCVMIASKEGPHTLQSIGGIYGLTRMRICQIEKGIFEKIRKIS
jgi:hypothetical protein